MQTKSAKKTKAAKAFFDLYKAMPDEVQKEVKDLILIKDNKDIIDNDDLAIIAYKSFDDIWNTPENDHWDTFLKKTDHEL